MLSISIRRAAFAAALLVSAAPIARADDPSSCPTWFPDFASSCHRKPRFGSFVAPSVTPYLFEDPFTTTGLYFWGAWHEFPNDSVFQGGEAGLVALQARVAITDRLSFIATKDGFVMIYPDNPILYKSSGGVDLGAGFKYEAVRIPEWQFVLSPIVRFEAPIGTPRAYQGNGDGAVLPSLSVGKGFGDFHILGDVGVYIPFNNAKNSSYVWYDAHIDYAVTSWFVPFLALSGQSWVHDGNGDLKLHTRLGRLNLNTAQAALGTGGFEGVDLTNLGSRGVANSSVITGAVGARIPLPYGLSFSAAWQAPMTSTKYIYQQRVTTDLSWEF
jgi:hypothetical protein